MSVSDKIKKLNRRLYPKHLFYGPEWLVLGVNNVCNLHCKMCDVGTGNTSTNFARNLTGARPLNMPIELFRNIIDQAAQFYPNVKIGYAFTEPLAYTHLIESLNYAKSRKLFTSATTNALMLPVRASELCEAGLDDLCVSLDGLEQTHNYIRGNKNSFQKAAEGIEKILSNKKRPAVSIFSVITEWNYTELKAFVDYFSGYPLKQIGFMHPNYTPGHIAAGHNKIYAGSYPATASNMDEVNLENIDLKVLEVQLSEIKKSRYPFPVTFSPDLSSAEELNTFYFKPEQKIGKVCNDAFRNIMIKSNGDVIPAHGRCYELVFGNLYKNNLAEIWNSAIASQFRSDLVKAGGLFPACARCCSAF